MFVTAQAAQKLGYSLPHRFCTYIKEGGAVNSPDSFTESKMKICSKCGLEKDLKEWQYWCRECLAKYDADKYAKHKDIVNRIKLERGCVDCGYRGHPSALHFDHRDPGLKSFAVARGLRRGLESILKEIDKCDVRCANCHAIRTTIGGDEASKPRIKRFRFVARPNELDLRKRKRTR
jgi:Zn finger protein HypA/HybF involved in hydrogenase expression